jgi:hypothetical protein
MKKTLGMLANLLIASTLIPMSIASAQTAAHSIDQPFIHPKWTGVWQGTLGGVPSVTLTLADDAGEANGTIVFHAIKNDNGHPYSFSTEPHTLIHPQIEGNTLTFQVKRGNGSAEILNMEVELTKDGTVVQFTCSNCGGEVHAELKRVDY